MENFKRLWEIVSCSRKEFVNIDKYLEALDTLREEYGLWGVDRRMCENGNKLAMTRFSHKLRFLKKQHIVRVIGDSSCPYNEWYEILPFEEWKITA
jgi:hypothetical protein